MRNRSDARGPRSALPNEVAHQASNLVLPVEVIVTNKRTRTKHCLHSRNVRLHIERLEQRCVLDAKLLITEFSAANDNGIRDDDGERPDWIEIYNAGDDRAELEGWFLTDDPSNLRRWRIPPRTLDPGAYEVIFASGKDKSDPLLPLHTDFKLDREGEFLALVQPDGQTVASEFGLTYPAQIDDYSYGLPQEIVETTIVTQGATAKVHIPTEGSLGTSWTHQEFDAETWSDATTGIGFGSSFSDLVQTDIKLDMIRARSSSAYIRIPFEAQQVELITTLQLRMKYDDGFIAYLNGTEVARRNAPVQPAFDSQATEAHANADATEFEPIDLTDFKSLLADGENVLAIHALNLRFTDTDLLVLPELAITRGGELQIASPQYFPVPTPGQPNGTGTNTIIAALTHSPNVLLANEALTVRADVSSTVSATKTLKLHYRVMYGAEVEVPMYDDGNHADGAAGDGVFGVTIPADVAAPGEMLRYYVNVEDADGSQSRWPNFFDPLDSEQYRGTIVHDPNTDESDLPVLHLFMQNPTAANTREGTRGAAFFNGEFYDNLRIDLHGNLTAGFPRKSRDIDLNRDHRLLVSNDFDRINDINLLTNYTDPSKMRSTLVYEAFEWAGAAAHFAFPVRTELNGQFEAIYDFVEDGDRNFLERIGRDPEGSLYNMEGSLETLAGADKRSGVAGDFSDLQSLVDGLKLEGEARTHFLYDNVNLPSVANYLATMVITSYGDCCGKNYYVYQDTNGTGQWEAFPWDVNIGLGALDDTFDEMRTDRALYTGSDNSFFAALYDDPDFNQMYLRRIRTLMDEIYGPPGSEGMFEQRIDELAQQLAADAPRDEALLAPIDDRRGKSWEYYVDVLRTGFVDGRRNHLYNNETVSAGGPIPEAQPQSINLAFGEIETSPLSGKQDEEFITLVNPNDFAVDISNWSLSGPVTLQFHPGTVIPAQGELYLSPNVNAFRARAAGPSGNQALFVQGPYEGRLPSSGGTLQIVAPSGRTAAATEFQGEQTPAEKYLRISELMFNPQDMSDRGFERNDFEYVELYNTSDTDSVDLTNVKLSGGIEFDFSSATIHELQPQQLVLVVSDRVAFEAAYGQDLPIAGQFAGQLSNAGEQIILSEGGTTILDFTYQDDWVPAADGGGASMVISDVAAAVQQWNVATAWQASSTNGGTPGTLFERVPGDSTGDGRFNSSDLVLAFQVGEYEDDIAGNSTFEEGDWNGDGDFTTSDLVFAFQAGTYNAAARSALHDLRAALDAAITIDGDERSRRHR